ELLHPLRLDVGVALCAGGVQPAYAVQRGALKRAGVEIGERVGHEHILRSVQRRLLATLTIRQPHLAEAHDRFGKMHGLREAPRGAATRIPGALVSDTEGRVAVVADAALQEELIV